VEALREQVRHLQGIIATRDKELEQRSEEIRRRDAALEREQELTAMFATRLGELEGPQDERPREQSAPATPETEQEDSPLVPDATFSKWTLLLSVIGVGIVAGVANPLMMRLLEDPLWVALSVLWVPLPVLGALLGSVLAKRAAEIVDRLSTFVKQLEDERRAGKIDEGRVAAYEDRYLRERERLQSTKALLPLYTLVVGIVTATSSVGTFWFVLGPATTSVLLREASGVALAQGVFAAMFVGFGSLIGRGRVRERHETARTVAREGGSAEIKAANQQATFGLVGTIITAVLALVGTLIQVFGG
jgi:hypothetical protein